MLRGYGRGMSDQPCVFCQIVAGEEPATVVREWPDAIAIVPLEPVTDGHTLVLPRVHVRDITSDPMVAGMVMVRAAELAELPCNVIANAGAEATQTVWHLHLHIVPRRKNDRLSLPWDQRLKQGGGGVVIHWDSPPPPPPLPGGEIQRQILARLHRDGLR